MSHDRTPFAAYPYRRSITNEPASSKPWVIGQYSGFSDPQSTNARFREIVGKGGSGLSVALDLPTQWGLDPDHDLAEGEIGRVGVSLSSLDDLDALLAGIDLTAIREISTTANSIGPIWVALVVALARRRGFDPATIRIRIQNDPLKEYVARGTHVLAVDAAAEFAVDAIEYCSANLPNWVPMTISGYHMRDAGASRVQELGFTLAHAREYLQRALRRGLVASDVARSVSWFLAASTEPLHEAAKFRAARELWSTMLAEEFGVDDEEALKLRIVAYTLGGQMSPFEIQNNTVRITLGAIGAVLGGAQTLFCSAIDEACGLPTDESALLSVRTQQIILRESGLADLVDAVGDSSAIEAITDELVLEARALAEEVMRQGGATAAIESGWTRAQIDESAWAEELRRRLAPRVGEESGADHEVGDIRIFELDPAVAERRRDEFAEWRARRSSDEVREALNSVRSAVAGGRNPIEAMVAALGAQVTIGELMGIMMDERGLSPDRQLLRQSVGENAPR